MVWYVLDGGPNSLLASLPSPPRRLGTFPSSWERERTRLFSPSGLAGGDVEERDRGGSDNGDPQTSVHLSARHLSNGDEHLVEPVVTPGERRGT